jgi:hypothetical protein
MLVRSAGSTSFMSADLNYLSTGSFRFFAVPCLIRSHRHTVAALDLGLHASWRLLRNVNIVYFCNAFELSLQTNIESDFRELALHQFRETSCTRPGG